MSSVNVGVVGASWFADLWYLPVLQMHPSVKLIAICSKNGENAKMMAEKYNIPATYTSYEEMFNQEELDGICIITPNNTHSDIVLTAVKKGLHVICEKPLAMDAEESARIIESVQKSAIVHAVNFTYRENPAVKQMKDYLNDKRIGSIIEADFEYSGDYGIKSSPGWRGDVHLGGRGGVLADLGSHLIDLAHYLFDGPIQPQSASYQVINRISNDLDRAPDSVFFTASLPNQAPASFQTSWVRFQGGNGQTIKINVYGDKGKMELLSTEFGISLTVHDGTKKTHVWNVKEGNCEENFRPWRLTSQNEIWKWADRMTEPYVPVNQPDFYDGHATQIVMEQILEKAVYSKIEK
ncbi:Gfo/Idh/MocA family oxidoreductase [Bacillus sp. NEB1478]|uniref:Gfo/Idh/MocA family protein n=1 Tax=Bacillus sp. NEB1478 TaxID=3073816 RepID=UPI002872F8D9|nr:Gfo/Idh/MocA family oxidoreductase [Bacillus sp. NEB1478]WNB92358.1 Gfo/Idh/MocA family oxidoreductase [Bacillus sp. NEB1478]